VSRVSTSCTAQCVLAFMSSWKLYARIVCTPHCTLVSPIFPLVNHCTRSVLSMWKSSSPLMPCFTMVKMSSSLSVLSLTLLQVVVQNLGEHLELAL